MPRRIALTSTGPLSGKTTLAEYLSACYGFLHARHTYTLYHVYLAHYSLSHPDAPLTLSDLLAQKEEHRQGLQELGIALGFDQDPAAQHWVTQTLVETHPRWQDYPIVFDNVRSEAQATYVRALGFLLVRLEIPESVRLSRAGSEHRYLRLRENVAAHPDVEAGIARPDLILPATAPPSHLAYALVGGVL